VEEQNLLELRDRQILLMNDLIKSKGEFLDSVMRSNQALRATILELLNLLVESSAKKV